MVKSKRPLFGWPIYAHANRAKLYKCLSHDFRCKKEIMFVRKLLNITGPDNVHPLCVSTSRPVRGANIDDCTVGSTFKSSAIWKINDFVLCGRRKSMFGAILAACWYEKKQRHVATDYLHAVSSTLLLHTRRTAKNSSPLSIRFTCGLMYILPIRADNLVDRLFPRCDSN